MVAQGPANRHCTALHALHALHRAPGPLSVPRDTSVHCADTPPPPPRPPPHPAPPPPAPYPPPRAPPPPGATDYSRCPPAATRDEQSGHVYPSARKHDRPN